MNEDWAVWLSYRPSDFLMFAPRIYWRLFESINAAVWPLQGVWSAAALAAGWAWARASGVRAAGGARVAALALALAWGFVAWAFLWQRYAPINWVAAYVAPAFALQALGLAALAAAGGLRLHGPSLRRHAGTLLMLWALIAHPLLAWASGRPWQQAEVPGLAPDPTAIATLGCLLWLRTTTTTRRVLLRSLYAVPLAWCAFSAATLWTMASAQAVWPLAAAALAVVAALRPAETRPSLGDEPGTPR